MLILFGRQCHWILLGQGAIQGPFQQNMVAIDSGDADKKTWMNFPKGSYFKLSSAVMAILDGEWILGHNFERGLTKDHSTKALFKLAINIARWLDYFAVSIISRQPYLSLCMVYFFFLIGNDFKIYWLMWQTGKTNVLYLIKALFHKQKLQSACTLLSCS